MSNNANSDEMTELGMMLWSVEWTDEVLQFLAHARDIIDSHLFPPSHGFL